MSKTNEDLIDQDMAEIQTMILETFTKVYYLACLGQTKPDGKPCAICHDNGHQAFECEVNAFNIFLRSFKS